MEIKNIHIFALAAHGQGISGSDRIFIEFAKRWSKFCKVNIWVWQEGHRMCLRHKLQTPNIKYQISNMEPWKRFGFLVNYFARILEGIKIGLTLNLNNQPSIMIYSASEFWMDAIPGWILKLRFPKIKWVAAWYQTAPNPLTGFAEGERKNRYRLSSFFYWMTQTPIKPLINKFADFVLVNNNEEKKQLSKARVVLGAVDLESIKIWESKFKNLPKIYDGVFQGRFHPQKGVLELIDIWKIVVSKKPDAKLVMIGDGPLRKNVELRIKNLELSNNIILTGYLFDGEEKYKIFSQSKIVLHPAFYDSGGMAAAEAMAFGLPCIGFDLNSFKSYYPKGMIKVNIGNLEEFANMVLVLLNDRLKRERIGAEGFSMIQKNWSWDKRAKEILDEIN